MNEKIIINNEEFNLFSTTILKEFNKYNLNLNEMQIQKFYNYYKFLVAENMKINLTAITEMKGVIIKHFLDSCLGEKYINKNSYLCDIGTGAGFPSVPLKILRPDLKVVLVDSLNKRVVFLAKLIDLLNLKNVIAIHSRAEDFLNNSIYREKFDCVVSRAVASSRTLLELTIPALKLGGKALFYKSKNFLEEEVFECNNACKILGCKIDKKESVVVEDNFRVFALFSKIEKTPKKYPRGKNLPKTQPI